MFKLIFVLINLINLCNLVLANLHEFDLLKMMNDSDYGNVWIFFPTGDGDLEKMYLKPDPNLNSVLLKGASGDVRRSVKFELYTRENTNDPKKFNLRSKRADAIEDLSNIDLLFNPSRPTKFIIHGWKSDTNSDFIQNIKENYLQRMDCNVIAIDWYKLASNSFYPAPALQTRSVGECVGDLMDYLVYYKQANMSTFHVIGHSLGAHVAGFAGDSTTLGQVGRITGLDPAFPGFEYMADDDSRLDKGDAAFVDIIHTCSGILGMSSAIGHVDFFPNGGSEQPGCEGGFNFDGIKCRHSRAHQYYAESILNNNGFYANKCKQTRKKKSCGKTIVMGDRTPTNARGNYYLETNDRSPYALGPRE